MESGSTVIEVWQVFKEYLDKKHIETAAERFVDLLADYGVPDETLIESYGADSILDNAIKYYLEDDEEVFDEEDGYGWDE